MSKSKFVWNTILTGLLLVACIFAVVATFSWARSSDKKLAQFNATITAIASPACPRLRWTAPVEGDIPITSLSMEDGCESVSVENLLPLVNSGVMPGQIAIDTSSGIYSFKIHNLDFICINCYPLIVYYKGGGEIELIFGTATKDSVLNVIQQ